MILNEDLTTGVLKKILEHTVTVDEYEARMGKDSDIVTLAFTIRDKEAGEEMCGWFERGYDWVLDAKVSDGEISPNKYLVFVEMYRRIAVPQRIVDLLDDLKPLTGVGSEAWTIIIDEEEYEPEAEILKKYIITSPKEYREKKEVDKEEQLNEYRHRAGLEVKSVFDSRDEDIQSMKNLAGI